MKILILSCSMGEGHNSAANALMEEFVLDGHEAEVSDTLSFASDRAKNIVSSLYNNTIKNVPTLFGAVYKAGRLYESTGLTSPVYLANTVYAENLAKYIEENKFDAAIATHLFGMDVLCEIKKKFNGSLPCYAVLTDYARIPLFAEPKLLDGYFIPHKDIMPQLTQKGIEENKIFCTGIPVSPKFRDRRTKSEARELLGIPKRKKVWLVMSGGIGGGNTAGLCNDLLDVSDKNTLIYVLVGKNTDKMRSLDKKFGSSNRLITVPFTTNVNLYMNAADILLSKAGGLSSTEAAVANIPMIHINAIPGCETENQRFFEEHRMSKCAKSTKEAAFLASALSFDLNRRNRMTLWQRKEINPYSARDIVRKVTENV